MRASIHAPEAPTRAFLRDLLPISLLAACIGAGCDSGSDDSGSDAAVDADAAVDDAGSDAEVLACAAEDPDCVEEQITDLWLYDTPNSAAITEEGTAAGEFTTYIDAAAGGMTPTESYVYGRFTETGLEKVVLDDEASFDSMGWDIAFRRYIIRVNSGVSGPSCVSVAFAGSGVTFDEITAVPTGLGYEEEAYFDGSCELVPDGSGLGSPATRFAGFWVYTSTVEMTGSVYVVELATGRHVKVEIVSYDAGEIRMRWAFLD